MLYDPKWEGPSPASFVAWLENKNPKEGYDFNNCRGGCLLGQYMQYLGIQWTSGDDPNYFKVARALGPHTYYASTNPQTFGAALKRYKEVAKL